MPPKKSTKKSVKKEEPKFIIFKNINPLKLIYEHLLAEITSKPEEIITINEDDDPTYVDHIIQDVPSTMNDILKESSMDYTLFTDIRKNNIKSWPILISSDFSKKTVDTINLFNKKSFDYNKPTKIKCWWCKNSFDSLPLGIPIRKLLNTTDSIYKNILPKDSELILTEGVVCSFPCAKSYIKNTCGCDIKYKDSLSILNYLYDKFRKINGKLNSEKDLDSIPEAPHWNQLKEFGGHLTIEDFRSTFGKIRYTKTSNILLVSYPIIFNEKIIDSGKKK